MEAGVGCLGRIKGGAWGLSGCGPVLSSSSEMNLEDVLREALGCVSQSRGGIALLSLTLCLQGVNKTELKEHKFWTTTGLGCKPYSAVYQLCRFGQKM